MYPHSIPRHRDLDLIPGNIPGWMVTVDKVVGAFNTVETC